MSNETKEYLDQDSIEQALNEAANYFELSPTSFYDLIRLDGIEGHHQADFLTGLQQHFDVSQRHRLDQDGAYLLLSTEGQVRFCVVDAAGDDAPGLTKGETAFSLGKKNRRNLDGAIRKSRRNHWFWGAILDNKLTYGQVAVAAVFINLFALASSLFIMTVYDRVIPNNAVDSLVALTAGVALVVIFDFILKMLRSSFIDNAGIRVDRRVAGDMFENLIKGRFRTDSMSTGGFANILREFESLKDMFASATVVALVDLPFILFFMAVVYFVGGAIVAVPLVLVPLVLLTGLMVQPLLAKYTKEAYADGQSKQAILVESVSGLETVRTVPATGFLKRRWLDSVDHHAATGLKSKFVTQIANTVAGSAQQVMQIAIVFYGVFLVADGVLSMGALIACVILSGRIVAPLSQISNLLTRINYALESYRALNGLFQDTHAVHHTSSISQPDLKGRIEFKNVSFRYDEESEYILKDLSFVIEAGQKIAVLGKIGSGKSTVLKLITGLLEPSGGQILIDGVDMRNLHKSDLLDNMGVVLQEPFLFSGSLRQNIAVGCRNATDEQILRAAQLAGAADFIGVLPQGYDTYVRERGQSLSGGQRQAVAIARALVGQPGLLLLDEPTSAMDMATEASVIGNLTQAQANTLVVVTHRTSMMNLVDKVMVLDRGQLVAFGPKQQVLNPIKQEGNAARAQAVN
ncbi:MAG: type I secretion system permease/ATPase [Pontibacterium sp.]